MLLGVSKTGVMRVDPKTKEVLDSWDYRIIRNWAYTAKTFLLVRDGSGWQGARLGGGTVDRAVQLCGMCRRCTVCVVSYCMFGNSIVSLFYTPPHYRPLTGRTTPFKPIRASGLILWSSSTSTLLCTSRYRHRHTHVHAHMHGAHLFHNSTPHLHLQTPLNPSSIPPPPLDSSSTPCTLLPTHLPPTLPHLPSTPLYVPPALPTLPAPIGAYAHSRQWLWAGEIPCTANEEEGGRPHPGHTFSGWCQCNLRWSVWLHDWLSRYSLGEWAPRHLELVHLLYVHCFVRRLCSA